MILFKNTISKMPDKDAFLCLCDSNSTHRKFNVHPLCWLNIMQKNLLSKTFLTHTLTHKRKETETIRNPRRADKTSSPGI